MVDLLRSKGLYRITLAQGSKPQDEDKQANWENKKDQERGLIEMSISPDLRFHIVEIDTTDEAMKKLNKVFEIKNEIRAHQLKNELLMLDPNLIVNLMIYYVFLPYHATFYLYIR